MDMTKFDAQKKEDWAGYRHLPDWEDPEDPDCEELAAGTWAVAFCTANDPENFVICSETVTSTVRCQNYIILF